MIKAFFWFLFIVHTVAMSGYLALGIFKKVQVTQFNLSVLAFSGILTTLSFSEIILRDLHESRKRKKSE